MKEFGKKEKISDYRCGGCNLKVDMHRRCYIDKLPNVLLFTLMRI